MAQLQGAEGGGSSDRTAPRAPSPVKVFLILIVILATALGAAAFYLSAREPAGEPSTRIGGSLRLTDEQAIARFKELWRLDNKARLQRDPTILPAIYTTDSPSGRGARDALLRYRRKGLFDRTVAHLVTVQVATRGRNEIRLKATDLTTPCIVNRQGESVLKHKSSVIRAQRSWILRLEEGMWKVHEVRTERARIVRPVPDACP